MLGSTATVRTDVPGGVTVVGANVVVRPVGAVAVRSTGLLKPPTGFTVIVEVCEPPPVIVTEAGLGDTVKSGPTTFTVTEVSLDKKPPVLVVLLPNMSTVYEPGIVELTFKVATYEPLVTVLGRIEAFKLAESGEAKRSTDDEKPLVGVIVIVEVSEVPSFSVREEGLAVR
jgi:hypothetical protein